MADITNHYPNDILKDYNKNRSIIILVKNNEMQSNNIEEKKKNLTEQSNLSQEDIQQKFKNTATPFEEQRRAVSLTKKKSGLKTIYGVALPLPNELSDNQSHQWETTEGFIGTKLGSIADTEIGGVVSINKALGELASVGGFRKPLVNPGYFQDYRGTRPREFNFTWDLVPNNEQEAKNIISIIYNLRKFTLPTSTLSGVGLLSPYLFDITVGNNSINNIMNMNNVVCTVMGINYSADNSLQFFADGIPKYMTLQMTFAERSTVTADYY